MQVGVSMWNFTHTPPHRVNRPPSRIQAGGPARVLVPGLGSHVLPPVPQHLRGREQEVLLAGLAVVGPLQGRRLLLGFGGGFLRP